MELCKGLENWFECLKCPYLCTKVCPIEGENVIEEMTRHMRLLSVSGIADKKGAFGKYNDKLD